MLYLLSLVSIFPHQIQTWLLRTTLSIVIIVTQSFNWHMVELMFTTLEEQTVKNQLTGGNDINYNLVRGSKPKGNPN